MKANYKFSNICGTVYRQGNVLFTPDGNTLYSPVGNRVSVFDLVNNKSFTFGFENRKNISSIALSPDGNVLISVDEDGRALLVNARRGVVLHHFNFKQAVRDIKFSPNGKYIAVTHGSHVQVCLRPFVLHRTYTGHHDDVLSIEWSPDSQCFISASKDMTARLFTLNPLPGFRPKTFAAYFAADGNTIYTVSKDGSVFTWKAKDDEASDSENDAPIPSTSQNDLYHRIANTRWGVHKRNYFNQANTKVVCTTFHAAANLLVVGFSTGIFGLWEMPSFSNIHTLSISQEKISSVAINATGEWLAFGARKLGQLLVWEWQSESYVLKQQGHYFDMNTLDYAPDGQTIATEHTAPVSTVCFAKQGSVLFTASLDGTVRAYDLIRYRNFRTFTSPVARAVLVPRRGPLRAKSSPQGSSDSYEVFLWSVQTGKLLDILTGHEGPISALAFSPVGDNQLASGSWDKTVRVWSVFGRSRAVEPFQLSADALAMTFRPDGRELAVSTLNGQITFFEIPDGKQTNVIEGRKDVSGGRKADDRVSAANSSSGKAYTSLAYTADGKCVLAGGNSKYVVLYDVREGEGIMLKKFQISQNLSLEGTEEFLDSRKGSDLEDRLDTSLPGARKGAGDMSVRRYRQEARTKCVKFSPTGRATVTFDPFDLSLDLTPQSVLEVLAAREYLKALVMAFRLNEKPIIQRVYESVPPSDIRLMARQLPVVYVPLLLRFVAENLEKSPHLEFHLVWSNTLLMVHGRYLKERSGEYASVFRVLQKGLVESEQSISKICDENTSALSYLIDQSKIAQRQSASQDQEMSVTFPALSAPPSYTSFLDHTSIFYFDD
ncbi:WD40-repeat-containing domain protein [Ephemerocybe angulata]|uniref:WD40-repeat-containing domain protein n=1 Tax=Ephemerocybe angulata TaxID=980116 RepID=A0A8H6HE80_9AGAR|nr:WD40-repeat-containing domain protein [Tulosesus angulatus]